MSLSNFVLWFWQKKCTPKIIIQVPKIIIQSFKYSQRFSPKIVVFCPSKAPGTACSSEMLGWRLRVSYLKSVTFSPQSSSTCLQGPKLYRWTIWGLMVSMFHFENLLTESSKWEYFASQDFKGPALHTKWSPLQPVNFFTILSTIDWISSSVD
jgi:hypothetical protein